MVEEEGGLELRDKLSKEKLEESGGVKNEWMNNSKSLGMVLWLPLYREA
jgi:hypothetical protein